MTISMTGSWLTLV